MVIENHFLGMSWENNMLSKMPTQRSMWKSSACAAHLELSSPSLNMRVLTLSLHQSLVDGCLQHHETVAKETLSSRGTS